MITTTQRYASPALQNPIEGTLNVHDGDRYVGSIHQFPDGRWCYGFADQIAGSADAAARELIAYKAMVARMPERGAVVRVVYAGLDDHIGTVEAERIDVFNGTTAVYVKVSGEPFWHHLNAIRPVEGQ